MGTIIGIMENKMETIGIIGFILGIILGIYWDNGKEHGNYYGILGLYRDSGNTKYEGCSKGACLLVILGRPLQMVERFRERRR